MFKYKVVRSNRKTMSVCVKADGTVVVSAPLKKPAGEIEAFVKSKSGWIEKHVAQAKRNNNFLEGVPEFKCVLVKGVKVPLELGERDCFSEKMVCARSILGLQKLYVDNLGDEFIARFKELAARYNFTYSSVSFKSYKSRWGCCDGHKKIVFNYKLLMLPVRLWEEVMLHELCHTVYMNHSADFHRLLLKVLPDKVKSKRELNAYSKICAMY